MQQRQNRNNQVPAANPGIQRNAPNQPQRGERHPADHLAVAGGVVSSIKSAYEFSDEAHEILARVFRHLQIGPDKSRYDVGNKQGYNPHGHALGAFLRSYFDDLIMYKYQPRGTILDVGASPMRNVSRYQDMIEPDGRIIRRPWLYRVHMMTPNLDMRDDMREQDHMWHLDTQCRDHMVRENAMIANGTLDANDSFAYQTFSDCSVSVNNCDHALIPDHIHVTQHQTICPCSEDDYSAIKSVESWYYPGVLDAILNRAIDGYTLQKCNGVAYIVGNDYHRMLVRNLKSDKDLQRRLTMALNGGEFHAVYNGCTTVHGKYESTHSIAADESGRLEVTAAVIKNNTPYQHRFPITADADVFCMQITRRNHEGREIEYVAQFELLEEVLNHDVPFVLYKVRITELSRWDDKARKAQIWVTRGDSNIGTLFTSLGLTKCEEVLEHIERLETKPLPIVKEKDIPISIFNTDMFNEKVVKTGDKSVNAATMKAATLTNSQFVLKLKTLFGPGRGYSVRIRNIAGVPYLLVNKRSVLWYFFAQEKASMGAMAPLEDVIKAYLAIGIKENIKSIQQTMVQEQRKKLETGMDTTILGNTDAYTIARVVRAMETQRLTTMLE